MEYVFCKRKIKTEKRRPSHAYRIPPTAAGQAGEAIKARDENISLPRPWKFQPTAEDPPFYAERKILLFFAIFYNNLFDLKAHDFYLSLKSIFQHSNEWEEILHFIRLFGNKLA